MNRREMLKLGTSAAAAELAMLALQGCGSGSVHIPSPPSGPSSCSKLSDIEHVVVFIQENRSFDHYFGGYRGVRGFSDKSSAFQQPDPSNTAIAPIGLWEAMPSQSIEKNSYPPSTNTNTLRQQF